MDEGGERAVAVNVFPHVVVRRVGEYPTCRGWVAGVSARDVHAHTGATVRTARKNIRHGSSANVPLKQAVVLEKLHVRRVGRAVHRSGIGVLGKRVAREVWNSRTRLVRKIWVPYRLCGRGKCEGECRADKHGEALSHGHAAHTLL